MLSTFLVSKFVSSALQIIIFNFCPLFLCSVKQNPILHAYFTNYTKSKIDISFKIWQIGDDTSENNYLKVKWHKISSIFVFCFHKGAKKSTLEASLLEFHIQCFLRSSLTSVLFHNVHLQKSPNLLMWQKWSFFHCHIPHPLCWLPQSCSKNKFCCL